MDKMERCSNMPFKSTNTGPFTRTAIEALRPDQMGVYGLFKSNLWVYIGSGDIRARLLDHLNGDNACITGQSPTHWIYEVTANYIQREKDLIAEFNPVCNKRVG
jgi:hypothetical protein